MDGCLQERTLVACLFTKLPNVSRGKMTGFPGDKILSSLLH
jgi:hypothetical protein